MSISHCLCFGVYINDKQIGFARIATDYVVFAYLMDVFILPEYRGNGYSKLLLKAINEEQQLHNCKMWMLKTADAHTLYKQFGYTNLNIQKN
ncbi:GNAT family N-acetyltransferase [Winogradskyella sp. PG-2]|uniref:GNAT family N-acetyltransferase n=1 Tax=Winogradskyella sp. PG-2 TaxID=754409 RepID=UPI0004587F10|nr:GNAT family N-acetyltransferase [Winogradskyella sp. PG-2]BAO75952.1 histone acetyltransferase HPA2 and related acetyltransferases [Winogradskyella sp. PG-2]